MKTSRILFPLLTSILGLACGGDDGGDTSVTASSGTGASTSSSGSGGAGGGTSASTGSGGEAQAITVTFAAEVGGTPFACGTSFDGLGTSKSKAELLDFRLYVHDVRLFKGSDEVPVTLEQDGVWQLEDLALLDFEDKKGKCANGTADTNVTLRGTIPAGATYDGIRFKLGVPFKLNHGDASTAPSPLNLSGLFWNWQGGRKFLRIDAMAEGAMKAFNLHLGSTGCDGDPASGGVTSCTNPNVASVELAGFDAATKTIVVDYGAMVADIDFAAADAGGASGCMAGKTDPECATIFAKLGLDIATGASKPEAQTAFKVK
jgi:uncharacterized repeat protein (TIGR04052 family)